MGGSRNEVYEDPSNPKLGWKDEELMERLEESTWHVRSWQLQNFETPTQDFIRTSGFMVQ